MSKHRHKIEFLHPYSPGLNPIEFKWAQAKSIRRKLHCDIFALFASHIMQHFYSALTIFMWNMLSSYYSYDVIGKQVAKQADNDADIGVWRKRMPTCNDWIEIATLSRIKMSRLLLALIDEKQKSNFEKEKMNDNN